MKFWLRTVALGLLLGWPGQGSAFDLQGHRGARGLAPENSLPAFATALSLGVTTLELDTQLTRDNVIVVGHDPILQPKLTRDAAGQFLKSPGPAIRSIKFAELQKFDVGRINPDDRYAKQFSGQRAVDGTRMPRLVDVIDLVRKAGNSEVRFNIETKLDPERPDLAPPPDQFADVLIDLVRSQKIAHRVSVQSFDWRTLARVRAVAPEIERVCLTAQQRWLDNVGVSQPGPSAWTAGLDVDDFGGSVPRMVKAAGCATWSPFYGDLSAEKIAEAKAQGLKIVAWTVNAEKVMESLIDSGVDGLISDYPDVLRKVLETKGKPLPRPTPVTP